MTGRSSPARSAPELSWPRRIGYGSGDFAFNLYFTTATLYLLFYYTDVLALSPSAAGWVFAGAMIWDALFDPAMGYIANRTGTRWRRYRPYLLWGAVPLAVSWALIFLPTGLKGGALLLYATAAHILFRTFYAVVAMPFLAMSAVLTRDSQERGVLAGIRMVCAATCGLLSAFLTLQLAKAFGGGQAGFFMTAILYGAIATAVLFITFAATREVAPADDEAAPSLPAMLRMMRLNRAFWIVSGYMLIGSIGSTFFQKTLPYYMKYALGREDLIGSALGILAGAITLSIPLWTLVMKRWSKRVMVLAGCAINLTASTVLWFAPQQPAPTLCALALSGLGGGAGLLGFWAMMPDTVEYGEWRTGVRAEGAVFGLVAFIQKGALGLAAAGVGEVLSTIGYRANVAQSPETLADMRVVMIAVPAAIGVVAASVIAFYPLSGRVHGRMLRIIERRRRRAAAAIAVPVPGLG